MGFLKGLFQPGWEKARARVERCAEAGDFGGALEALDRALEGAPEEEKGALKARRVELRQMLAERHLEAAQDHGRIGDRATMRERLELARSFAEEEETRQAAEVQLQELEAEEKREEEARRAGMREPAPGDVSDEELLLALTAAFPEEMQEAYEEADEGLRRAAAATQQGRVKEAMAWFEEAGDVDDPLVCFEHGRALLHVGRVEEALEAFRKADESGVSWIPVKLARADAAVEAGEVEEAEEVLQEAHDLDPEDLEVFVAICRTALHAKDPAYGLEAAAEVLERHPGHRGMLLMKARLLDRLGRLDEAWDVFDAAVRAGFRYDATSRTLNTDVEASLLLVELTMRRGAGFERAEEVLGTLSNVLEGGRRRRVDAILASLVGAAGRQEEAEALWDELAEQAEEAEDTWVLMAAATVRGASVRAEELRDGLGEEEREAWDRDRERFFAWGEPAEQE